MAATGKTTSKAVKQAEELRISQVGDFKARLGGVMELPSGLVIRTFNPGGMNTFLNGDAIPNRLMPLIQQAIKKGDATAVEQELSKVTDDLDMDTFQEMTDLLDKIALKVVVEPALQPVPADGEARSEDMLYVDELPLEDKSFIMQWVATGVKDLEIFRQRQQQNVAALAEESGTGADAK